jgi:hypothetical protein
MKIVRPILFVFLNPAPEKKLTDLGQASAFLLRDLQQGSFDFAGYPESDAFVLCWHVLAADSRPLALHRKSLFLLDVVSIVVPNVQH